MLKELNKISNFDHLFRNNQQISIKDVIIFTEQDEWEVDLDINIEKEEKQIWSTLINTKK